jgi:hypothetical protein
MLDQRRTQARMDQRVGAHQAPRRSATPSAHDPGESLVEPDPVSGGLDIVNEWGIQSFPASDPPANW